MSLLGLPVDAKNIFPIAMTLLFIVIAVMFFIVNALSDSGRRSR